MDMMTKNHEASKGVGKKLRRTIRQQWKRSGTDKSLREWAKSAEIGDAAYVWLTGKLGK